MHICLVGPWFKREGISAYHRGLCEALIDQGHHVVVWCPWKPTNEHGYETKPIKALTGNYSEHREEIRSCDVVHLQSENIYAQPGFSYINILLRDGPPVVQTLHSNCNHYLPAVKKYFVHNTPKLFQKIWCVDVGNKMMKVPMWCPEVDYVEPPDEKFLWIRWKNNGRTNVEYLEQQIDKANESLDRKFCLELTDDWLSDSDLIKCLQSSNLFTPLYHKTDAAASSNTLTWMSACGRPSLISDTHWFEGILNKSCVVDKHPKETFEYLIQIARKYDKYVKISKKEADRMKHEDTWGALVDRIYLPIYRKVVS